MTPASAGDPLGGTLPPGGATPRPKLRVLVIDDEKNIRSTLTVCLASLGCEVSSTGTSQGALNQIEHRAFDAAFVDLKLGGESGLDVIPRLIAESPSLTIVLMTAYAIVETAVEAIRRGAWDYLQKPFTPGQIEHLVDKIVGQRALWRRVADLESRVDDPAPETDLVTQSRGRVEAAEGGTLFLDEIGEIPPSIQTKLLRFLQDHDFERLGENRMRHADVRVIAATNRDLEAGVRAGLFREDLLYRLDVIEIRVPPLRERREDILPLARRFLVSLTRKSHRSAPELSRAAGEALANYDWPGNVRELRNAIERAWLARGERPRARTDHGLYVLVSGTRGGPLAARLAHGGPAKHRWFELPAASASALEIGESP